MYLGFDFEALLVKDNFKDKKTTYSQNHIPIGVVVKVWCDGGLFNDFIYAGTDCVSKMCKYLEINHDKFVKYKTDKFWKENNKKLEKLALELCDCPRDPDHITHRKYCGLGKSNPSCRCATYMTHNNKCPFKKTRFALLKEYTTIPIVGFNSGKV